MSTALEQISPAFIALQEEIAHTDDCICNLIGGIKGAMEAYLTFDGNTAEALAFYAECLGGKVLFSMTWGESPMAADMPAEARNKIMHATLEARGHKLMAADGPPGYPFEGYKGFSLSVQSNDLKEGEQLFNALSAGGKITMPFAPTFWAAGFGMLVDKFGVSWMVNCEQPAGA